jgi:hypothetical protein
MALPKWLTPEGQLGIVPELEYYEFPLDAYDASGGTLRFFRVSGTLPLGLQIIDTGKITGIPVSELGGDQNVEYTFTIRVKNTSTNSIADRTFNLTVTNVAPPIINVPTRNSYLGLFLDGTEYIKQLEAIEFTPGADLSWSLKSGDLPPGLILSSTGILSGYFQPIPNPAAGYQPNWDRSAWSFLGWDSSLYAIKKRFTFTIKVTDGVNSDLSTYTLDVYPRNSLTTDHDDITVDTTLLGTGVPLTIDYGNKHNPIITTTQTDLSPVREGSYFSFKINAIDLDGDNIDFTIPALITGGFDEQTSPQGRYVVSQLNNGRLSVGIFPDVSTVINSNTNISTSTLDPTQAYFEPGDNVKILNASNVWQFGTINSSISVKITGNTIVSATTGQWLTQASSSANATITDVSSTTGTINIAGDLITGYINTLRPTYQITFDGNIYANVGDYITQTISGANARVTANIVGASTANVIYITGNFTNGNAISGSNIAIRGLSVARYPTANVKDIFNTTITANVGEYITQTGYTGNAVITANIVDDVRIPVTFLSGTFNSLGGNIKVGGIDVGVWINNVQTTSTAFGAAATVGQYITQALTSANAIVTANVIYGTTIPVRYISGTFASGSSAGNLTLAGANINAYPTSVLCSTDITATYNTANYFDINGNLAATVPQINGSTLTYSNITSLNSVGVTIGSLSTEGTVGFDSSKYDQGALDLPAGLTMNFDSGWITGQLPSQTLSQIEYQFEVIAFKKSDPTYQTSKLYVLTVLGDLNNRIDWITPSDLGTIETGKVSDLFVYASSPLGKTLLYELSSVYPQTTNINYQRLPQGLDLTLDGLISGRVSFEVFSLDQGNTQFDVDSTGTNTTTFDFTYTFTVTARDAATTISANRTFKLRIKQFDKIPYENLYLKALPNREQRTTFQQLMNDKSIFPLEKIYRPGDPWFGLASDLRTLFLAGLSPSTLAEYTLAANRNHFIKRLLFGGIKTAQVLDSNFNVKYEVVYLEVFDENSTSTGDGPADTQYPLITNPYYDKDGNSYTVAYPNAFEDMGNVIVQSITYQNKGVLPDWMTSRQTNGRQLGFVHAAVLAYTMPGESALIAYRLKDRNFNFNTIDFTVDRYHLDNIYTTNYDITANAFVKSSETTFDRYPALSSTLTFATTVDYAISISYEEIHEHYVQDIKDAGGMDGIKNFKDGDTIVFAQQEYTAPGSTLLDYTQGWSNVIVLWDTVGWAQGTSTDSYDYIATGNITANANIISSSTTFTFDVSGLRVGMTPNVAFAAGAKITSVTNYVLDGIITATWSNVTMSSGNITAITSPINFIGIEADNDVQVPFDANLIPPNTSTIVYNPSYTASGYDLTPGQKWDQADYLPGYDEYILGATIANGTTGFPTGPADGDLFKYNDKIYHYDQDASLWRLANQRIAVWRININTDNIVTLSLVRGIDLFDTVYVRNGFTYGGTNIYYDPAVKPNKTIPNYSIVPQQIKTLSTRFDGNGTLFYDNRDSYIVPEQGDKYIKFTKTGVFT